MPTPSQFNLRKNAKSHFLLLKVFKKPESAQLYPQSKSILIKNAGAALEPQHELRVHQPGVLGRRLLPHLLLRGRVQDGQRRLDARLQQGAARQVGQRGARERGRLIYLAHSLMYSFELLYCCSFDV